MGYSTDFTGELTFVNDPTAKQLAKLKSFMGEDCRDHPEWGSKNYTYIDLEITEDFTGIQWDGSEKTYDLPEKINMIIREMREDFPNFGLEGKLEASGESFDDRWYLVMVNGVATKKEIVLTGTKVTCPHCEEEFILNDENSEEIN